MTQFAPLFAHPQFRDFVRFVLSEGGVTELHSPTDHTGAIDSLELSAQKARRDFALQLVREMGWTLDYVAQPPPATPRQAEAISEPGGGTREHQNDANCG